MTLEISASGLSDVGRSRSENQDHFLIGDLRRQLLVRETDVPNRGDDEIYGCEEGSLLVVADGMGGHQSGELASRVAVESAAHYVLDMMQWFLKLTPDTEDDFVDELSDSLVAIQRKIWRHGSGTSLGMGTTVTMAYLLDSRMYVVHAGDSRCYLYRENELRQLTTDHTIAQQLIDAGGVEKDDPMISRWHHVLYNCVGGGEKEVRPEAIRCDLCVGDTLLLCSDGLTGMVADDQIAELLRATASPKDSCQKLVEAANDAGGTDNITAIVCHVTDVDGCEHDTAVLDR